MCIRDRRSDAGEDGSLRGRSLEKLRELVTTERATGAPRRVAASETDPPISMRAQRSRSAPPRCRADDPRRKDEPVAREAPCASHRIPRPRFLRGARLAPQEYPRADVSV